MLLTFDATVFPQSLTQQLLHASAILQAAIDSETVVCLHRARVRKTPHFIKMLKYENNTRTIPVPRSRNITDVSGERV